MRGWLLLLLAGCQAPSSSCESILDATLKCP
jgi:hypothetical protein